METDRERLIMRMMKGLCCCFSCSLLFFLPSRALHLSPFPFSLLLLLFSCALTLPFFFLSIPGAPLSFNVIE